MRNELEQWIAQGYAVYRTGRTSGPTTHGQYLHVYRDNPTPAHQYYDHCKDQNIPQITAVYVPEADYATIEVDFVTTENQVLSTAGQQELCTLLEPYKSKRDVSYTTGGRYSYFRYIPVERLRRLMPQVVKIVRAHTETEMQP